VRQRALLRAAVFGRAFATHVPKDLLRSTALKLRLLNALREPDVGLPLTMPQLEALSLPVVVSRCATHGRAGHAAACLLGAFCVPTTAPPAQTCSQPSGHCQGCAGIVQMCRCRSPVCSRKGHTGKTHMQTHRVEAVLCVRVSLLCCTGWCWLAAT
jgi:hypothetical protein